jgi:cell division protein FtsI/penicillin-binding protein 2
LRLDPKVLLLTGCALALVALAAPWPGAAGVEPALPADAGAAEARATTEEEGDDAEEAEALAVPPVPPTVPTLGPPAFDETSGRFVAALGAGKATLTFEPELQKKLEKYLADYRVPWGATVLIEPRTGRVVAMAEHSQKEPEATGLAMKPIAPAASVFKIVTTAALLEKGIGADDEVCFHGGKHRVSPKLLEDNPRRDHRCLTLSAALGHSANVVFAKLAERELDRPTLVAEAERFLFNAAIPFAWPVEPSTANIPDDAFERATTAAGFGDVRLSPLHGALLAAAIANEGVFIAPDVVASVEGAPMPVLAAERRIMSRDIADAIGRMMASTVTEGTARRVFHGGLKMHHERVTVAGKTGSLAETSPYRDYTWFVGYAPIDDPQIAVASVVVNERLWRVKAQTVAHEALKAFFAAHPPPLDAAAAERRTVTE